MGCCSYTCVKCGCSQEYYTRERAPGTLSNPRGSGSYRLWDNESCLYHNEVGNTCIDCGKTYGNCVHKWSLF